MVPLSLFETWQEEPGPFKTASSLGDSELPLDPVPRSLGAGGSCCYRGSLSSPPGNMPGAWWCTDILLCISCSFLYRIFKRWRFILKSGPRDSLLPTPHTPPKSWDDFQNSIHCFLSLQPCWCFQKPPRLVHLLTPSTPNLTHWNCKHSPSLPTKFLSCLPLSWSMAPAITQFLQLVMLRLFAFLLLSPSPSSFTRSC